MAGVLLFPTQHPSIPRMIRAFLFILASSIILLSDLPASELKQPLLRDGAWYQRWYLNKVAEQQLNTKDQLQLLCKWTGQNEFFTHDPQGLSEHDQVTVNLQTDSLPPAGSVLYIFTKDWDNLWRQLRFELGQATEWQLTVPLAGPDAALHWGVVGHQRPWHQLAASQLIEFGLKFDVEGTPPESEQTFTVVSITGSSPKPPVCEVRNILPGPDLLPVGEKYELSFQLTHPYSNPFDTREVDLMAEVTRPDGTQTQARVFYHEPFAFDEQRFHADLEPAGTPDFRLRYTPTQAGLHRIAVRGHVGDRTIALPSQTFQATPAPDFRGFLQRSTDDPLLLTWSQKDGEHCPVGVNVRSPYDNRYRDSFPYTAWEDEGLTMYKRLFERYAALGIDTVELWMSPWWLALEWIPDAPGNHGLGYYSPWRAWKLDRIFEWAEEYDIDIILLIHNHGKFSTWCDSDWARSPWNAKNGGPHDSPTRFFYDEETVASTKRMLDYLVARWGYSPRLMSWKLFSEIDLTGKDRQWYKHPHMATWHKTMGAYLKEIDPNKHLVSTHWSTSYQWVNRDVAGLKELDIVLLDAYYQGSGANKLYVTVQKTGEFALDIEKPCVITEFGGNPYGDTMGHILHQHHLGLWSGYFHKMASIPFFWWFTLLEEHPGLYSRYRGIARFIDNEDRTGAEFHSTVLGQLGYCELRTPGRLLLWIFDRKYYYSGRLDATPEVHDEAQIQLELDSGRYHVEFWDPTSGDILITREVLWDSGAKNSLPLPAFERDIAVKLSPLGQTELRER